MIREYTTADLKELLRIWNRVVADGMAFPQCELLDEQTGAAFFAGQTRTCVATDEDGRITGLYILHPNNVGRVGHIANASYAVDAPRRGEHIGEALVRDSLRRAKEAGYRILQFNAVVASNAPALHLYERIGFVDLGIIPGGFHTIEGRYEDIHVMYYDLTCL